jgi:dephospho-CoA kinase
MFVSCRRRVAEVDSGTMRRVLLTGISGVGKSTVVAELAARGYKTVDTDYGWCHTAPDGEWLWREDLIEGLLSTEDADVLFIAGAASNQVKFYRRFHHVVLLSAPADVIVERLEARTNNAFGKAAEELTRVLNHLHTVEPMLRNAATYEIVTARHLDEVVEEIVQLVES